MTNDTAYRTKAAMKKSTENHCLCNDECKHHRTMAAENKRLNERCLELSDKVDTFRLRAAHDVFNWIGMAAFLLITAGGGCAVIFCLSALTSQADSEECSRVCGALESEVLTCSSDSVQCVDGDNEILLVALQ